MAANGKGGARFSIPITRAVVKALTNGSRQYKFVCLPGFDVMIPTQLDGVDSSLLDPRSSYTNLDDYHNNLSVKHRVP